MNRSIFCFVMLGLIFGIWFVSAVEDKGIVPDEVKSDIKSDLINAGNDINAKTDSFTDKNLNIPSFLESLFGTLFKVKGEITVQVLAINIALFVILFSILYGVFRLMPFLNSGVGAGIGSLIVSLLASMSGGLVFACNFIMGSFGFFNFLTTNKFAQLVIIILIMMVIWAGISKALRVFRHVEEKEEAKQIGEDLAEGSAFARIFSKFTKKSLANPDKD